MVNNDLTAIFVFFLNATTKAIIEYDSINSRDIYENLWLCIFYALKMLPAELVASNFLAR